MENKMITLFQALEIKPLLIFSIFIIPLLFLFVLPKFQRKRYPPGPKGWPVIGNMGLINQLTHRGLANLAKKYGGVLHLRIGFSHTIVVSSPDAAREVLQVRDNIFSNRPASIAITYLTYNRSDMVFAHYGPFWRQMRKLCVVKLFSRKRNESWNSIRDEIDNMIRTLADNVDTAVNLGELVFGFSKNVINRAAFGSSLGERHDEFIKTLLEFSKLFSAFNIADFVPFLEWVDPQGFSGRLAKVRASLDGFIDSVIDDHLEKKRPASTNCDDRDMVDELLAYYSDDEAEVSESEDLHQSLKLSRVNIKAIIMDVMFGGTETVASAIEWAISELLTNPKDLEKVQQELTNVVGLDDKVSESHIEKLTYLHCCVKETLRLHPPVPVLLHETAKESEISGYHIPAKSRVMVNVWAIGRDKSAWEDADSFKPARFLEDGAPEFNGADFDFIPFGSGRRSCPGIQLGLYALEMALAHLLYCFTWELPDGMKLSELDMSDACGLTAPRATRLVAVPRARLLCPL